MINKMEKTDYNVHPPHLYEGYKSTIFRSPTTTIGARCVNVEGYNYAGVWRVCHTAMGQ